LPLAPLVPPEPALPAEPPVATLPALPDAPPLPPVVVVPPLPLLPPVAVVPPLPPELDESESEPQAATAKDVRRAVAMKKERDIGSR